MGYMMIIIVIMIIIIIIINIIIVVIIIVIVIGNIDSNNDNNNSSNSSNSNYKLIIVIVMMTYLSKGRHVLHYMCTLTKLWPSSVSDAHLLFFLLRKESWRERKPSRHESTHYPEISRLVCHLNVK